MSKSVQQQVQDRDQEYNRYAYAAMRKADPSLPAIPHFFVEALEALKAVKEAPKS